MGNEGEEVKLFINSVIHGNMGTGNGATLVANLLMCYKSSTCAVHNSSPLKNI